MLLRNKNFITEIFQHNFYISYNLLRNNFFFKSHFHVNNSLNNNPVTFLNFCFFSFSLAS